MEICGIVYFLWRACNLCILGSVLLKFGLSEKHTKFEKIFLMVLTNQLIYLVHVKTMRKIFFKLCVLLKKSELYLLEVLGLQFLLKWKVTFFWTIMINNSLNVKIFFKILSNQCNQSICSNLKSNFWSWNIISPATTITSSSLQTSDLIRRHKSRSAEAPILK